MQLRRPVPWRTVDVMNSQLAAGLVGPSLVRADGTFTRHAARVAGGAADGPAVHPLAADRHVQRPR
jgi:hypothetical protein